MGGLLDGLPKPVEASGWKWLLGPQVAGGRSDTMTIGQVDPDELVLGRPDGNYLSAPGPKNPIGAVVGYPETGKNSWRANNDDVIVAATAKYNSTYGYLPGDAEYMTSQLVKSWVMEESGSGAHRHHFETDPFQVNIPGDWVPEKNGIAGLRKGQAMTPQTSAEAALKWARYKSTWPGREFSSPLARRAHYGVYEALLNYNGSPRESEYTNDILNRGWASYGDWQE